MSALSAAFRIARRDARRAKGRSALVVAMIALPILGVGTADVLYRTFQLTPEQKATRSFGQADASLADSGQASVHQTDASGIGFRSDSDAARTGPPPSPLSVLPAGSRVLEIHQTQGSVSRGDRTTAVNLLDLPYQDSLVKGMYTGVGGRPATAAHELALSTELASRLHVGIGDSVVLADGPARVTGLVRSESSLKVLLAFVPPGSVADGQVDQRLVRTPRPLTWADVERANARGFIVSARGHVPGEPSQGDAGRIPVSKTTLTFVGLIVGMVLLEIVLLAGPAFAVGVKRRSRDLALVAATGGERRHLRAVVLAGGVVLGALGGAVGAVGGIALARATVPAFSSFRDLRPGPFEVRPLELAAIIGVGVLTATLAALVPARTAARVDVLAALTGRRGSVRSGLRLPALGVIATVLGAAIALRGAHALSTNQVMAGSIVAELGLVATTPFLVGLMARLGRFLPVGPRFALRDAARNRGRTAPAVSAILAAVAGAIAVGTFVGSLDAHDRERYSLAAPKGSTIVQRLYGEQTRPAAVEQVLHDVLPGDRVLRISGYGNLQSTSPVTIEIKNSPDRVCPRLDSMTKQQLLALKADVRCQISRGGYSVLGGPLVGGPDVLKAASGWSGAAYTKVLERGGAVVPIVSLQRNGTAVLVVTVGSGKPHTVTVPAVGLPRGGIDVTVLSPQVVTMIGAPPTVLGLIAQGAHAPSSTDEDRLRSALTRVGAQNGLLIERGYTSRYGIGLLALLLGSAVIVLGASGTATGLAAADGKADLATLAAVGATPRTRRTLAAFQSAVTAGLGTVLGVVAGLIPGIAVVQALNSASAADVLNDDTYPLVLPWSNVTLTLVVVPLVAALAAGLLTRSRLPLVHRAA